MNLSVLEEIDELQQVSFDERKCFLHKEHRWVLPIIFYNQQKKILSHPCTLIMFDAHHDTLIPTCMEDIRRIKETGITFDELINLCKEKLSDRDDDWVKAGMELGLINDVVIFGVQNGVSCGNLEKYEDHQKNIHKIKLLGLLSEELDCQGDLSDIIRLEDLSEFWKILGWQNNHQFSFVKDRKNILLDFDLDCFMVHWRGYKFPWPDKVFEKEFQGTLIHQSTSVLTGKDFINGLINKAALVTIAREPDFCDGEKKANEILGKVNHFLFDDKLNLDKTTSRSTYE
jgi:hypothetical protein